MDRVTFDDLTRRTAALRDRRSLVSGLSAAILTFTGIPPSTEAKKHHHKHRKHKRTKACKKRVKECRQDVLPDCELIPEVPNCKEIVNNCCKKACKSVDKAFDCLADNFPPV